jgi:hypothetical protein
VADTTPFFASSKDLGRSASTMRRLCSFYHHCHENIPQIPHHLRHLRRRLGHLLPPLQGPDLSRIMMTAQKPPRDGAAVVVSRLLRRRRGRRIGDRGGAHVDLHRTTRVAAGIWKHPEGVERQSPDEDDGDNGNKKRDGGGFCAGIGVIDIAFNDGGHRKDVGKNTRVLPVGQALQAADFGDAIGPLLGRFAWRGIVLFHRLGVAGYRIICLLFVI